MNRNSLAQLCRFVVMATILLVACSEVFAQQVDTTKPEDFFEMSLEELMEVPVVVSGALTKTTRRKMPSTVTTLTQEDIRRSGARSVDELLDITIPNLQIVRHAWEPRHIGLRGIISDRDVKYLLLVNGRVMNERTHFGALSERDLPMLTDIHHIDVVRGPGSALYGPGAIGMVINIITENAMTFQGMEVTTRLGALEEFYSGEFKYGRKFSDDRGIFLYGGISKYIGADTSDAPFVFGINNAFGIPKGDDTFWAGHHADYRTWRDHQAFRDLPKLKLYGQYTDGGLDVWMRYTRGGEYTGPAGAGNINYMAGFGYQQATAYINYHQEIDPKLSIDYALSYDIFDYDTTIVSNFPDGRKTNHREDEYYGKVMLKWTPNDRHLVAFGGEYSHEEFGMKSLGYPHDVPRAWRFGQRATEMPRWSTDTYSILGEYQWRISDKWTSFIGGRLDDNSFTPWMFSPRASLIYTPNKADTFKLMWSRSTRMGIAEDMKAAKDETGDDTDPEIINAFEIRYERQHTKNLWLATSLFYHDLDVVGWNSNANTTANLGNLKTFGFEVEATYKTERAKFTLSHGFTKLHEIHIEPGVGTFISAHPYGYGHDLANWSNHVTKLTGRYDLTNNLSVDGSLRMYWGYPGALDYAKYANDVKEAGWAPSNYRYQRGYTKPFGISAFLNLGLEYKPSNNLTVRVDGYNMLGWLDIDLNKRLFRYGDWGPADYRCEAPAIGVSLRYKF